MRGLLQLSRARIRRFAYQRGDRYNALRRHVAMLADQTWTLGRWKLGPKSVVPAFDGDPRFALVTVNFSTTHYLKLMLITLAEQAEIGRVHRLIVVDNDSRDGGLPFLRELTRRVERAHLLENRRFPTHARGLRLGMRHLSHVERRMPVDARANVVLACDTDVIFRNPRTIQELSAVFAQEDAAFAGELRRDLYPYPEAQASFFAVRRDCYARPDVAPIVHHGAPAYWMQRSLWRAGLHLHDFPSNRGGYILHRGRAGVEAARTYRRGDPHATAATRDPHYMGVPDGAIVWNRLEARYAWLLQTNREDALLALLSDRFSALGEVA